MPAIRTHWQDDFPNTIIDRKLADATSHWCYQKAKAGDTLSAYILAKKLVSENAILQLTPLLKSNVVLVPVLAEESVGLNKIPLTVAYVLSEHFDLTIETEILQAEKVSRTGGSGWHRLAFSPSFVGKVQQGQSYFLIDDTQTQGGTFASLKGYIENNGGIVVGCYALTGKQYSAQLRLSTETLQTLRNDYAELESFWQQIFGYGFDCLTESEARFIINSRKKIDEIRAIIFETRNAGFTQTVTNDDCS